jgi:hypothetical protein
MEDEHRRLSSAAVNVTKPLFLRPLAIEHGLELADGGMLYSKAGNRALDN